MGLFGTSPADTEVEAATSDKNVTEKWDLILDVCDKAGKSPEDAKIYLKAILKRLNNTDPHVGLQAATLLDACVNNSGKTFHIEVASRDFENEYTKLLNKVHDKVSQKLRESLKKWAEGEFKTDQQLNLIPSLYSKLKKQGIDFSTSDMPVKKSVTLSKDPNVVQSQEEEDQIAKALELSLKEVSVSPRAAQLSSSLYPSTSLTSTAVVSTTPAKEPRKVRALYDFEAAEDNELTFTAGEIIVVLDDSNQNWWKGSNHRGEGLFPANFVTSDLTVEPEQYLYEKAKKSVAFKESIEKDEREPENVEIDEAKIDRLQHLLHEADPTNPETDTEEMLKLEREVNLMGPLIDAELERVDRKHAQLTQLSSDLVEALGLYHQLMREPQYPPAGKVPYGYTQTSQPSSMIYNPPQSMPPPSMVAPHFSATGPPDRSFHSGGVPQTLPPHFTLHHGPPSSMGPMPPSGPQSIQMPPGMGLPPPAGQVGGGPLPQPGMPQQQDDRRNPNVVHYPPGLPQVSLASLPQSYQPSGPMSLQGGPPSMPPGHFAPPASNMHMI